MGGSFGILEVHQVHHIELNREAVYCRQQNNEAGFVVHSWIKGPDLANLSRRSL